MLATIGSAIVLFVATNVDDLFVLLGFFADPRIRVRHVVLGQYLGIAALVALSIAASIVSLTLAPAYVGLLGLVPVAIGIKKLLDLRRASDDSSLGSTPQGLGNKFAVALVTVANGGDNLGIYTPVFANSSHSQIWVYAAVFAIMVALWLAISHRLVNHPSIGAPIREYGPRLVPFVLIAIGLLILHESDSFGLLASAR